MVKYWDRLYPLMEAKGISNQELANTLGISFQAIVKVREGGAFGTINNSKAAKFFGVNPDWLATGNGKMALGTGDFVVNPTESVPCLTWKQAKNWKESIENLPANSPRFLVTCKVGEYTYGLKIDDDFNIPSFPVGSEIVVEPTEIPINQKWVIIDDGGEQASLRRLVISGAEQYLTCDNERYPVRQMKATDLICGTVKQLIQNI